MIVWILIGTFAVTSLAAPATNEARVDLVRDDQGRYKYTLSSKNVTRVEERFLDGSVKGEFSYLLDNNVRQTVRYSTGFDGLVVEGSVPPKYAAFEPEDLPEVAEAKKQFSVIAEKVEKYLTEVKGDKPKIDLSRQEFLKDVSKTLDPELTLVYSPGDGKPKEPDFIFS